MSADARAMLASSPQSSDHATHHDTPSTNITALSPEGRFSTGKKDKLKGKAPLTLAPITRAASNAIIDGDDVFLNPDPASCGPQSYLSPTADVFTPGYPESTATPRPDNGSTPFYRAGPILTRTLGAGSLVLTSVPDYTSGIGNPQLATNSAAGIIGQPTVTSGVASQHLVAMQNLSIAQFRDIIVSQGNFSIDEGATRAFAVENCVSPMTLPMLIRVLKTGGFSTAAIDDSQLSRRLLVMLSFDDVRDARNAFIAISANLPVNARVTPYTSQGLAAHRGNNNSPLCSLFEGQVVVYAYYQQDANPALAANHGIAAIRGFLDKFGEIKAMHSVPAHQRNVREFRVEFFNVQAAAAVIDFTQAARHVQDGILIEVVAFAPTHGPILATIDYGSATQSEQVSVTGRSMVPAGSPGYDQLIDHLRNEEGFPRRRGKDQYTRVEVGRIRIGADVRTTVMLRNLPNKVTQAQVKEIVDKSSFGEYDFSYLRIDFANNCNVGYAFINFIDPYAIIPFAEMYQGVRWTQFNSTKVAEISYATIQGRENLIQKFRNSSVMLEHPSFRPKLFYTIGHPRAGEEEAFPAPDNLQKMRRSVDNAESVGLYKTRNYSPPSRTSARRIPSAPATSTNQPARLHPAQLGSAVTALSSPGVQALINPRTTPATPITASGIYNHSLFAIQSGPVGVDFSRATPPATPYESPAVPIFSPAAPSSLNGSGYNTDFTPSLPKISEDTPTRGMVNTRSPFDPFRGRADADTSLFAPRQGQAFREQQRRRRSQFDRGTPGAELESMMGNLRVSGTEPGHINGLPEAGASGTGYGRSNYRGV